MRPHRYHLQAILILAVATVLLALVLREQVSTVVVGAVTTVLVVLIMVLNDAAQYLESVLKSIASIIRHEKE